MTIYNITHNDDIDGYLSAYILWTKYPNIITIGTSYDSIDTDIDLSKFTDKDTIIFTDFCLDVTSMKYLVERCKKIIYIDHHIRAIKTMREEGIQFYLAITDVSVSACKLTWKFAYPLEVPPIGVEYCSLYDSFTFKDFKPVYFNFGLYSLPGIGIQGHKIMSQIVESDPTWMERIIESGKSIVNYRQSIVNKFIEKTGFETIIDNKKFLCINQDQGNTLFFNEWFKKYDGVITFIYNGKEDVTTVGIYSDTIDTTALAKRYGGGGHKGASGFVWENTITSLLKTLKNNKL